ncbi:hypothetical protein [aff. Roholtiella sp. LEGE 12411]|uniref:hypothetical protein n=1 Tax=aff. Roholtiella sp. LEGE 12411 TaxID=1828822 RepID=UPI001881444C|nr:hypothetical protein [aff. Roholtiella sp. LEGE 12411]MBE9038611.1 hypothetical protein [aff. Roholtiella sp. LEGE 12411]
MAIKPASHSQAYCQEINAQPSNKRSSTPTNNFNTRLGIYFYGSLQYSDNPQIPVPIIIFEDKGIDPDSGKFIVNIKTELKGWSK